MYDPSMVDPLVKELTDHGFESLNDEKAVSEKIGNMKGTALVIVNSICGCAAAGARPGVIKSLENKIQPDNLYTVFAGQYPEATNAVRSHFHGYTPSSPAIGLLKDGQVLHMLERTDIEGNGADSIADELSFAYNRHCLAIEGATKIEELLERFPKFSKKITEKCGSETGVLSAVDNIETKELIYAIEDILDAEPELEPIGFTPEGAVKFDEFRKKEGEADASLALTGQGMGFKESAGEDDIVFESEGLKLFVEKSCAKRYSGKKVHFAEGGFNLI